MEMTEREKELQELLEEALDLFDNVHELCDDLSSIEWLWKWKVKYAIFKEEPVFDESGF